MKQTKSPNVRKTRYYKTRYRFCHLKSRGRGWFVDVTRVCVGSEIALIENQVVLAGIRDGKPRPGCLKPKIISYYGKLIAIFAALQYHLLLPRLRPKLNKLFYKLSDYRAKQQAVKKSFTFVSGIGTAACGSQHLLHQINHQASLFDLLTTCSGT